LLKKYNISLETQNGTSCLSWKLSEFTVIAIMCSWKHRVCH